MPDDLKTMREGAAKKALAPKEEPMSSQAPTDLVPEEKRFTGLGPLLNMPGFQDTPTQAYPERRPPKEWSSSEQGHALSLVRQLPEFQATQKEEWESPQQGGLSAEEGARMEELARHLAYSIVPVGGGRSGPGSVTGPKQTPRYNPELVQEFARLEARANPPGRKTEKN